MFLKKLKELHQLRQASLVRTSLVPITRQRSKLRSQLGMTLLEIMIVLAIIAVVMGFLVGPKVLGMFQSSKVDTTRMAVKQITFDAYTQWSLSNPAKQCPSSLKDLEKYRNSKSTKDGWGNEFVMFCGDNTPAGDGKFAILSMGPDGKQGTEDDVKSWE